MSTAVDTGVEAEILLGLELDEELPCERPEHGTTKAHSGWGRIYVEVVCPGCGLDDVPGRGVQLVCEKFYNVIKASDNVYRHRLCHKDVRVADTLVYKGRR